MSRRICLVGATGFFGSRLARLIAQLDDVTLIATSRSLAKATSFADNLRDSAQARARIEAAPFDRDAADAGAKLSALDPWLVVDASGPFQGESYDLARAAIDAGAHWIDLADASDYLTQFPAALDAVARSRGVLAIAGASSTPALSFAVVDELTREWRRIDSIDIAIMPGGAGQVGEAVIRAALSYAGRPTPAYFEGVPTQRFGWGSVLRERIADLGVRYLSPVETVDAVLMPERFGVQSRVAFYAGLESRIEQFGLVVLAFLRRRLNISSLERLAPLLERSRHITRLFASDRGGMNVTCTGIDAAGQHLSARWSLLAERNEGPNVPVLPALAAIRMLLAEQPGNAVARGARTGNGVLALANIEREMQPMALWTGRQTVVSGPPLFRDALGDEAYLALPKPLRDLHDTDGAPVWAGRADIKASAGVIARAMRSVFGFPPSGTDVPVCVTVDRSGANETWTRNFGGRRFTSHLSGHAGGLVSERFGPFRIDMKLQAANGVISMPVSGWRLGSIPLPGFLAPRSDTREFVDDQGRFNFDVAISVPFGGVIAHYRGWLKPQVVATQATTARDYSAEP